MLYLPVPEYGSITVHSATENSGRKEVTERIVVRTASRENTILQGAGFFYRAANAARAHSYL